MTAITMTERAAVHVRKQIAKRGKGVGIRVGVKTSGCSGLAYLLEFVDVQMDDDFVFESYSQKIFVDPKSYEYITGTELDYVREGLNEGFQFNNPNVESKCGCGESFNV